MCTDAVRRRLELLNRRRPLAAATPGKHHRHVVRGDSAPPPFPAPRIDWFEMGEVVRNPSGSHYRIRFPLDRLWQDGRYCPAAPRPGGGTPPPGVHPELAALAAGLPHAALLLDLETCGFAGSMIFLIGLLRQSSAGLSVELLLARDYAEERAILETFWSTATRYRVLVTFNGKSFDWPMICDRSTRHHLRREPPRSGGQQRVAAAAPVAPPANLRPPSPLLIHCDLLHHARRRWQATLPDCKLQTLETYICGRRRAGDLPGHQIPDAYHQFVRTGDARQMGSILHHNALDLVTLLELAQRLAHRS